jgi:hypothetical protein
MFKSVLGFIVLATQLGGCSKVASKFLLEVASWFYGSQIEMEELAG